MNLDFECGFYYLSHMNKIVVIGDTHCSMNMMERIFETEKADGTVSGVLHCGDMGVYDEFSWSRISDKERHLIESHNDPIYEFFPYIHGEKKFLFPVFMIPGNHDDFDLIDAMADGEITVDNLFALKPDSVVRLSCDKNEFTVMGLGKILPENLKPANRHQKKIVQQDDIDLFKRKALGEKPDVVMLHEPPLLARVSVNGRYRGFGSSIILDLVNAVKPRMVFAAHMHFEYRVSVDTIQIIGLGHGVKGRYGVLYDDGAFDFKDVEGREFVPAQVEAVEQRRMQRPENEAGPAARPIFMPVSGKDIIELFGLHRLDNTRKRIIGDLFKNLKNDFLNGKIQTREDAFIKAEAFLSDHNLCE